MNKEEIMDNSPKNFKINKIGDHSIIIPLDQICPLCGRFLNNVGIYGWLCPDCDEPDCEIDIQENEQ